MSPNFWRGKKVLLTGHTGFKGGWLSLWLQSLGSDVVGYSLDPSRSPNLYQVANVDGGVASIIDDVRDLNALLRAVESTEPEIIFHLAAQSLVLHSYEQPLKTYSTNVMGTVNLLEAVRACSSVKSVVIVTTDKCYENKEWVWSYRENEPVGGFDPYSNSKGCAELVVNAYRDSFFSPSRYVQHGVAIASARAGNVIGGGDWSQDRLIPDAIRAFEAKQALIIRNPLATRPWQHVLEPLSGYLVSSFCFLCLSLYP
jgi:CDP-glucose 4,6-dehydratase